MEAPIKLGGLAYLHMAAFIVRFVKDTKVRSLLLFGGLELSLELSQSVAEFVKLLLAFGQLFLEFLLLCPGLFTSLS